MSIPIIYRVFGSAIPGGCLGFLNHQAYGMTPPFPPPKFLRVVATISVALPPFKKIQAIAALLKLGLKKIPWSQGHQDQKIHSMQKRGKMYQNNQNYTLLYKIYIVLMFWVFWYVFCPFLIFRNILEHHHVSGFSELENYCILLKKLYAMHCISHFHPTWGDLTPSASLPSCPDIKLYTECRRGNPGNGCKWRVCQR